MVESGPVLTRYAARSGKITTVPRSPPLRTRTCASVIQVGGVTVCLAARESGAATATRARVRHARARGKAPPMAAGGCRPLLAQSADRVPECPLHVLPG